MSHGLLSSSCRHVAQQTSTRCEPQQQFLHNIIGWMKLNEHIMTNNMTFKRIIIYMSITSRSRDVASHFMMEFLLVSVSFFTSWN